MTLEPKKYSGEDLQLVELFNDQISFLKKAAQSRESGNGYHNYHYSEKLSTEELVKTLREMLKDGMKIATAIKTATQLPYHASPTETRADLLHELEDSHLLITSAIDEWQNEATVALTRQINEKDAGKLLSVFTRHNKYKVADKPHQDTTPAENLDSLGYHIEALETIIKQLEGSDDQQTLHTPADTASVTAEIKLIGNKVTLWLSNVGTIPIKPLRADGPQFNFVNYLLTHPNTNISRGDVQTKIDGCNNVDDLTEIVRYCGFDKQLKRLFFEHCTQLRVQFKPMIQQLPHLEAEKLIQKYKS